jgi:hypothetical protein
VLMEREARRLPVGVEDVAALDAVAKILDHAAGGRRTESGWRYEPVRHAS